MAVKQYREQIRVDMLTSELVFALISKLSSADSDEKQMSKSEIYRIAVYRMAREELSDEEFQSVLLGAVDLDRI